MGRAQGQVEQLIRARVHEHPDQTWLKWRDEEFSWEEALSLAERAANGFLELGVRPGERVALMMANRPEFIWLHLGILFIGAHSVPVNISQRGVTLAHILADSDATTVVFAEDLREAVLELAPPFPSCGTWWSWTAVLATAWTRRSRGCCRLPRGNRRSSSRSRPAVSG